MGEISPRSQQWAETMSGHAAGGLVRAHAGSRALLGPAPVFDRERREEQERLWLRSEATRAVGAGHRAVPEEPDAERTCFERDRDRIVHSTAFRRLAGKTQVVVHPSDHQRTRLTHALEVAQVATSIARASAVNVALVEAIALGHDCGHGPGGHASEDAFDAFLPGGYEHGPWGSDVVLAPLNLCAETLDGIRNHSWSRPAPDDGRRGDRQLGGPDRVLRPRSGGRHPRRHRAARRCPGRGGGGLPVGPGASSWVPSSARWSRRS